jgi:hypothetical protein
MGRAEGGPGHSISAALTKRKQDTIGIYVSELSDCPAEERVKNHRTKIENKDTHYKPSDNQL